MKKKIGLIVGIVVVVVAVVLGVVFLAPDKDVGTENPSENISQTEDVSKDVESSEKDEESTKKNESSISGENEIVNWEGGDIKVIGETVALTANTLSKYGISSNYEISAPYPLSKGFVYVVRDYLDNMSSKTYVFYATAEKVVYCKTRSDIPKSNGFLDEVFDIAAVDLDGVPGEEIILNMPNGGNAGYDSYILKINEDEVVVMQSFFGMEDANGFSFRFEAPFKMVATHELSDEEFVIEMKGDEEHEGFFDAEGNPERDGTEPMMDGYFIFEPVQIGDGYGVRRVQHTSISSHANCAGYAETIIQYVDGKFEVVDARFLSADEDVESTYEYMLYSEFARCDINEDGVDEIITHTGTCEMNRLYNVYTVANGKLVYAGSIGGWHASLYDGKGTISMAAGMSGEGRYYIFSLKDNKLVIDKEGNYTWDENSSTLPDVGEKIEFISYKYETPVIE